MCCLLAKTVTEYSSRNRHATSFIELFPIDDRLKEDLQLIYYPTRYCRQLIPFNPLSYSANCLAPFDNVELWTG